MNEERKEEERDIVMFCEGNCNFCEKDFIKQ